jgi:S-adenosylmethionine-dependent methyltransferase
VPDLFSDKLAAWREYTSTPWARIRYEVVGEVLRRQAEALGERLRVLDVGGGDGIDAIGLARAGHDVTIVDPSTAWLEEAQRRASEASVPITTVVGGLDDLPAGEWDLALCHFVLRYRPSEEQDLAALARTVRPGGRLSLIDANPGGRVFRELLQGGPRAALEALETDVLESKVFETQTRTIVADDVIAAGERHGMRLVARYGVRIANDLVLDNEVKHDAHYFADLLALEKALCDREPFNRVGFAWNVVLEKGSGPA